MSQELGYLPPEKSWKLFTNLLDRATFAAAITACNGLGGIAGSFIVRQKEAPRYITAIWVSIGSHILIICIVAAFSLYFWYANGRQKKRKQLLERTIDFRYTY
jgi:hypothetical protein